MLRRKRSTVVDAAAFARQAQPYDGATRLSHAEAPWYDLKLRLKHGPSEAALWKT
jgi:hypothetical protein